MNPPVVLVMAKTPVSGQVKTRLGVETGMLQAAELATAALLDTLDVCEDVFASGRCYVALDGDPADAIQAPALERRLSAWTVLPQRGNAFGERLTNAHHDVSDRAGAPVVQLGMDTPHVTADDLMAVSAALTGHDAVLGPAEDGGWWVLGLNDPRHADGLSAVTMSTSRTCADTYTSLRESGATVTTTRTLRDVDTVADAHAAAKVAPLSRFARTWADVCLASAP